MVLSCSLPDSELFCRVCDCQLDAAFFQYSEEIEIKKHRNAHYCCDCDTIIPPRTRHYKRICKMGGWCVHCGRDTFNKIHVHQHTECRTIARYLNLVVNRFTAVCMIPYGRLDECLKQYQYISTHDPGDLDHDEKVIRTLLECRDKRFEKYLGKRYKNIKGDTGYWFQIDKELKS